MKLFCKTGSVDKKAYSKQHVHLKVTIPLELMILHLVLERPGIYLREIQMELFELSRSDVSCSSICKLLGNVGYTNRN